MYIDFCKHLKSMQRQVNFFCNILRTSVTATELFHLKIKKITNKYQKIYNIIIKNISQYLKTSKEASILIIASNVLKIKQENKHNSSVVNLVYHFVHVNVSKIGVRTK